MSDVVTESLRLERARCLARAEELRQQLECDAVCEISRIGIAKCQQEGGHAGAHVTSIKELGTDNTWWTVTWYDTWQQRALKAEEKLAEETKSLTDLMEYVDRAKKACGEERVTGEPLDFVISAMRAELRVLRREREGK